MTHANTLGLTVEATHRSLEERFHHAASMTAPPGEPRDRYQYTDSFLAATSRHLAAVDAVLLPLARRRLTDGQERFHEYLHAARRLEVALAHTKARLYGEAHAVRMPWGEVWSAVRVSLDEHNRLERALVTDLVDVLPADEWDGVAQRVYRSEVTAPTRPHPYSPHAGVAGRVARRLWSFADRFWDAAEGRMLPEPVRPPAHDSDSLWAQYVLGTPHLDRNAPVLGHRHVDNRPPHSGAR